MRGQSTSFPDSSRLADRAAVGVPRNCDAAQVIGADGFARGRQNGAGIHVASGELLGRKRPAKRHPQSKWDEEHREYPQRPPHKLSFGGYSD